MVDTLMEMEVGVTVRAEPINMIEDGIKAGHYHWFDPYFKNTHVPLKSIDAHPRNVRIVPLDDVEDAKDCISRLKEMGKRLCPNAANYLLGIMAQAGGNDLPSEIRGRCIIAVEDRPLVGLNGFLYFLSVMCDGSYRKLYSTYFRQVRGNVAVLAEDDASSMGY